MSSSSSSIPSTVVDGDSENPTVVVVENQIGGSEIDASTVSESSDNVSRRDVWNRHVNGAPAAAAAAAAAAPVAAEAGIVIGGADLWPSLSEGVNTRVRPSYRTVPENSVALTSHAASSRSTVGHGGSRTNSTHSGGRLGSHRQSRNNAARSSVGNGERSHQQQHLASSQGAVSDVNSNNGSYNGNSQMETGQNNGPRPHLHSGGNHSQHGDSNRRGNGGPQRGDGSHGRRRNGDRDANAHPSSYNGRNGPVQPPVFPGPFPIPIPQSALPVAPFPPPRPPPYPPIPLMAPGMHQFAGRPVFYGPQVATIAMRPHPLYVPVGPSYIITELLKQIDYYFSDQNLVRDVHLRRNMDEQGWVVVTIIAQFKKVREIIAKVQPFLDDNDIDPLQFILNAMLNSYNVEVQGDKLRKRIDWKKYVLRNNGESSMAAAENQATEELAVRLENTVIDEEPVTSDSKPVAKDKTMDNQAGHQPS